MWAANTIWDSEAIETFNFDPSAYMSTTAQAVIKSKLGKFNLRHMRALRLNV